MIILVRYSEIYLKGKNRGFFERALVENVNLAITDYFKANTACHAKKQNGRIVINGFLERDADEIAKAVANVFGVHSVSIADELITDLNVIEQFCAKLQIPNGTFKVITNRADKKFELNSMQLNAHIGGILLDKNPGLSVDVHNPNYVLNIDIRENGKTYIFTKTILGVGGMPVRTGGSGLLLLSGGIDSPVAGFLAAKRGLSLCAIHFTTPPFTSEASLEKVKTLAESLKKYCGGIRLFVVPITEQMQKIKKLCNEQYTITLMRRLMIQISEQIATANNIQCIVTGENLAQVASQTIEGITTNNVCAKTLPIIRPLICFDKEEIVTLAKKIGTYQTSIISHQDCCVTFVPERPATKPTIAKCEKEETKLDIEAMINKAIADTKIHLI